MEIDFNELQVEANEICKKLKELSNFGDYLKECGLPEKEALNKYLEMLDSYNNRLEEISDILERSLEVE